MSTPASRFRGLCMQSNDLSIPTRKNSNMEARPILNLGNRGVPCLSLSRTHLFKASVCLRIFLLSLCSYSWATGTSACQACVKIHFFSLCAILFGPIAPNSFFLPSPKHNAKWKKKKKSWVSWVPPEIRCLFGVGYSYRMHARLGNIMPLEVAPLDFLSLSLSLFEGYPTFLTFFYLFGMGCLEVHGSPVKGWTTRKS